MNSYLETAIAVILVIVIFSVIAYVIQELVAANLQYRGKMLRNSLHLLLDGNKGSSVVSLIYCHPQINKLMESVNKLPSYIPAANFALAIVDEVAKRAPQKTGSLYVDFGNGIAPFAGSNQELQTLLNNYLNISNNLDDLLSAIEKWYNEYMDRVTGWYKRNTRTTLRVIAVSLALLLNINLIGITQTIHADNNLKEELVHTAEKLSDEPDYIRSLYQESIESRMSNVEEDYQKGLSQATSAKDSVDLKNKLDKNKDNILKNYNRDRIADIDTLLKIANYNDLPIGWNEKNMKAVKEHFILSLLGWFMAAVAISMGAPFWFDLLIKLVNIRRSGIKPKDEI